MTEVFRFIFYLIGSVFTWFGTLVIWQEYGLTILDLIIGGFVFLALVFFMMMLFRRVVKTE